MDLETKGLKWNLEVSNKELFGCVSSSNEIIDKFVDIKTSGHLFWTTSLC